MFRLATALKGYREAGSLNDQINLFGFVDEHTFLTKTGDVGVVLGVKGVDYECLAVGEIDNYTKRLESAFKILDDKCRIYQYLFKGTNPAIPSKGHNNPIVNAAIESRISYLKGKAQSLYGLTIYFVVLLESPPAKRTVSRILSSANSDLKQSMGELKALLSTEKQVALVGEEIRAAQAVLSQKISSFILQLNDFLPVELLK
jgi:type IV secretion system protein VirB4